jgi:hypothetical protein
MPEARKVPMQVRFTERVKLTRQLGKAQRAMQRAEECGVGEALRGAQQALQQATDDLEVRLRPCGHSVHLKCMWRHDECEQAMACEESVACSVSGH